TTLGVRMTLKEGLPLESFPHQLRLGGGNVLVVVLGRAPICHRCRRTWHIRRDCKAPLCSECRVIGHETRGCVKTYARVAGSRATEEASELLMDEEEAEEAAARVSPKELPGQSQPQGEQGGSREVEAGASQSAPTLKTASEGSYEASDKEGKATPEDTVEDPQPKDSEDVKGGDEDIVMTTENWAVKRRLDDSASGSGEAKLRLEREWCGKVGRYKSRPE
ncbi:uncharacterized protein LOC115315943, partial [Ixodes scapularis]|uniref:uncharacterized protein LOC115315943 n=1 Tax=Ixodes scapularis TaxID=6945 RepID=UPI001A9DBF17